MAQELRACEHTRDLCLALHELGADDHVEMPNRKEDDRPCHIVMDIVRDHLAAEHAVHPAEERPADRGRLRHVVHGKARQHLNRHEHVEPCVRSACERVAQERLVRRLDQHIVLRHFHRIRVVLLLPEMREKAVAAVDDETVDAADEARAERERRDEVNVARHIHQERRRIRLRIEHRGRLRDEEARDEEHDDRYDHQPVEDAQKGTKEIVLLAYFLFHAVRPLICRR